MRRTALMFVLAGLVGALVATPLAVYASHQFSDVQDSNPFHDDISWLADAEVTLGCGPNVYCPKDNVTREQMAAFMRRLAENRVVDADTVDGLDSTELTGNGVALTVEKVQNTATVATADARDFISVTVECPDGYTVIGGGGGPIILQGNPIEIWAMDSSNPVEAGQGVFDNDGWIANWQTVDGGNAVGTYTFSAEAICADLGSAAP